MSVEFWKDGQLLDHAPVTAAKRAAHCLKSHGYYVLELYEIGKLVTFSPYYGELQH